MKITVKELQQTLTDFRFKQNITIRWADIDRLGHVNNAVYLTYLEQARIDYLRDACHWPWHTHGLVLAHIEMDYLVPILETDKPTAYIRCVKLGSKSFKIQNVIAGTRAEGQPAVIFAHATTVLVVVRPEGEGTLPIPATEYQAFIDYELVPPVTN